ncbi:MAG TPA: radical SAM protein [Anaeromyxobacteraceae bacterium]|nr:radical SAM protein [Anaeromyxobacteraceae bacterium]
MTVRCGGLLRCRLVERLSIELTDRCEKACAFCYARARPGGERAWRPEDVVALVLDCAAHGTRAVSFGGGEPLEYPPLLEVLAATRGRLFRSFTTSGLQLDGALDALATAAPEKIHVSIHDPADAAEVARVVRQVRALEARGIRGGVNVLVRRSGLAAAREAGAALRAAGIGADRIVWLPMRRHGDAPSAKEVAAAAGGPFQSATCLGGCAPSPRFASLDAAGTAAWCSYTRSRAPLRAMTHAALLDALAEAPLAPCGGTPP